MVLTQLQTSVGQVKISVILDMIIGQLSILIEAVLKYLRSQLSKLFKQFNWSQMEPEEVLFHLDLMSQSILMCLGRLHIAPTTIKL